MLGRTKQISKSALATIVKPFCTSTLHGAGKQITLPEGAKSGGNYSPGILIDGTLYISGQGGEDSSGNVPKVFEDEVKQALQNVNTVLKAAGMTPDDVVSVQVYLADASLFQRMNAVYITFFKDPRPTRTTVIVPKLVVIGTIEITVTARK